MSPRLLTTLRVDGLDSLLSGLLCSEAGPLEVAVGLSVPGVRRVALALLDPVPRSISHRSNLW